MAHLMLLRSWSCRVVQLTYQYFPGQKVTFFFFFFLVREKVKSNLYTFTTLWANSAGDKLVIFSYFPR